MFGFIFGTVCLFVLIGTLRRGRRGYAWRRGFYGHHHGHEYGGRRRAGRSRFATRWLFEQLDTTPGQEKAIVRTIDALRENMVQGRDELTHMRRDVAQAIGGDVLDQSALDAAAGRVEGMIAKAKSELTQALIEVHTTLDGRQRKELAELIVEGPSRSGMGYC
jgi:Spy/CpxP family protein refolding chaperone